ncbi:hypothetical protein HS088_TW17G00642 [Tripterygium wilfordii]|uniref:DUF7722 domain-containing protein n=1 Tax=Tripterygium wilfordii TaxID=458696 RepID=A0A7J7CGD2_TRIWF|nr:hypothetical protein HS088_TW17G00642 [Tripterygium wilfordii]
MSGGGMESVAGPSLSRGGDNGQHTIERCEDFQMPLHYPRYTKEDYQAMSEWKLDCLLKEYGLPVTGNVDNKRNFAMGAFLWPHQ